MAMLITSVDNSLDTESNSKYRGNGKLDDEFWKCTYG